jgi:hypothetical protein
VHADTGSAETKLCDNYFGIHGNFSRKTEHTGRVYSSDRNQTSLNLIELSRAFILKLLINLPTSLPIAIGTSPMGEGVIITFPPWGKQERG